MEYKTLGKTGLKVSRMGFGGIPIQKIDEEGTRKLLQDMVKRGINYIDSARGYTVSEQYIGYGLEGIRDQFVLATKSWREQKKRWQQISRRVFGISAQTILICIRYIIRVWNSWIR